MIKRRGFTLIEIAITLLIVSLLAAGSFTVYQKTMEEARKSEAVVNVADISKYEEAHKMEKGGYAAAGNTADVNAALGMDIAPKYYEYKVAGVTDDNFIVIAKRIGEGLDASLGSSQPIVVAMNKTGFMSSGYEGYVGDGIGTSVTQGGSGGSGGSSGGGSSGGGGGGSSGGGSGGGSSGSGSGGSGGGSSGGGGGGSGGGGEPINPTASVNPTYDSDLMNSLNLLKDSQNGAYGYNLILANNISVIYDYTLSANTGAVWRGSSLNTIYVNSQLKINAPESAIAAIIAHEAVHVDYEYNPQKWILDATTNHGIAESDLHITAYPYDSVDQEYNAFVASLLTWKEIKGSDSYYGLDYDLPIYEQGEPYLKQEIATRYAASGINLDPY